LRQLKLPTFLREYDHVAAEAAREGLDHPRYLLRLAELELIDRERRMVERRIRAAKFPAVKSFDTFDFRPGEGTLAVDDPFGSPQRGDRRLEGALVDEAARSPKKARHPAR
jgi:DNA replication protein DnaC